MKSIKIAFSIYIVLSFLNGVVFSDTTKEDLPKIGYIINEDVYIRAGDNINFEALCKLEKNDPVKIVGKRYSWIKIALPKTAYLYIKTDFVEKDSKDTSIGVVNAANVNLRARPGTKFSILGQVSNPKKLRILEEKDGWYKVEPPDGICGWVHSDQLSFSFNLD